MDFLIDQIIQPLYNSTNIRIIYPFTNDYKHLQTNLNK